MSGAGAPTLVPDGAGLRIGIARASWHAEVMAGLAAGARRAVADCGVSDVVDQGCHGEMAYLGRPDSVDRRGDLRMTMEDVRSVIVVSQSYFQPDSPGVPMDPARGVVSRYARGGDYHELVKDRLHEVLSWLRREVRSRKIGGSKQEW